MKNHTAKAKKASTKEHAKRPARSRYPQISGTIATALLKHIEDDEADTREIDGSKARTRLDRPTRRGFASGGGVNGPSPSLKQASNGVTVHHPIVRLAKASKLA